MSAPTTADLQVRGGVGGTTAELEALDALAAALTACAQALGGAAVAVAGVTGSPDLLGTAVLAPRGAGEAVASLARCGAALLALATEVHAVAAAVRAAVAACRSWDGASSSALEGVRQDLGGLVLWAAVPAALGTGAVATTAGTLDLALLSWVAGRRAEERALAGGASPEVASALGRSTRSVAWATGTVVVRRGVGGAASSAWEALGPAQDDVAELGVDALVGAAVPVALAAGVLAPGALPPAGEVGAPALARAWAGLGFHQGTATRATLAAPPTTGVPPARTPGDLVRSAGDLKVGRGAEPGSVRVDRTPGTGGAPGRVVVYLPATQVGVRPGGTNPADMETNLRAVGRQRTAVATGTIAAMRDAGVGRDDEVAFVGFSQGGLTAAELAGDPEVRAMCEPRAVLTAGSPTATSELPADVSVLSLEHDGDPMAALDGAPNPDLPSWTTVRAPTDGEPHSSGAYGRTADLVAISDDPSLVAFGAALAPFLATGATTTSSTYQLVREVPPAPTAAGAPRPAATPAPSAGGAAALAR